MDEDHHERIFEPAGHLALLCYTDPISDSDLLILIWNTPWHGSNEELLLLDLNHQKRARAKISANSIVHACLHPRLPLVVAVLAGDRGEDGVPFALEFIDIELQPTTSGNNWETGVTNHRLIAELGTFHWTRRTRVPNQWNICVHQPEISLDHLVLNYTFRKVHTSIRRIPTNGTMPAPVEGMSEEMECGDVRFCFRMTPSRRMSFILRQNYEGSDWSLIQLGENGTLCYILAVSPEFIGWLGAVAVDSINGVLIFATKGKAWVVYC
ncbi:hypothetical protein B0H13DRAFT_1890959 [Mycena leptocephala]|nr:hypothetical protein B0H13DRAFT_1890959 [Mycena leptocephala]